MYMLSVSLIIKLLVEVSIINSVQKMLIGVCFSLENHVVFFNRLTIDCVSLCSMALALPVQINSFGQVAHFTKKSPQDASQFTPNLSLPLKGNQRQQWQGKTSLDGF